MIIGDYFKWSPTTYVIGIAILIISHMYVYFQGRSDGLSEYHEYRANVAAQMAQLQADADKARLESRKLAEETSAGWSAAVQWYRDNPRIVRVQPNRCEAGLRPVPANAGDLTLPYQPQFGSGSAIDAAECEERLNEAVKDAAWIEHVKDAWQRQSEIGR